MAFLRGRLIGFGRWVDDRWIRDYADFPWAWSAALPEVPRAYAFHLVVDAAERGGRIGPLMAGRIIEEALLSGCGEVRAYVTDRNRYRSFGFERRARFWVLRLAAGAP